MAIKLGAAVVVAFALYYLCAASLIGQVAAESGEATFYTPPYTPSACFGFDPPPSNGLFAAASPDIYQNGAACGKFYTITCTGATSGQANACTGTPTVTVEIIDLCPGCFQPGFDLSETAFNQISFESVGRININFNQD
jgi:expansin (peptidoglycan-binding protein)